MALRQLQRAIQNQEESLEAQEQINKHNPEQMLAIINDAIVKHEHQLINIIIQYYRNIGSIDFNKPLLTAIFVNDLEIIDTFLPLISNLNRIAVPDSTPLLTAVSVRKSQIVAKLIAHGARVNTTNSKGISPLHLAVKMTFEEKVNTLIHRYHALVNIQDYIGRTPLEFAIERDDLSITKALLAGNANPNIINNDGENAVYQAVSKRKEILELVLLQGGDPNQQNNFAETPLVQLLINREQDMLEKVKLLLKHGCFPDARRYTGETCLHIALEMEEKEIIRLLIEHGADVNIRTECGETALIMASLRAMTDIVELILQKGTDIEAVDMVHDTAIHLAVKKEHAENIKILLKYGAKIFHDESIPQLIIPQFVHYPSGLILAKHAAWLQATGEYVNTELIYKFRGIKDWFIEKYESCLNELMDLNTYVFFEQMSAIEILFIPKIDFIKMLRNTEFQEALELVKDRFQDFKEEFYVKTKEACEELAEWITTEEFLEEILANKIPLHLCRLIALYIITDEKIKF